MAFLEKIFLNPFAGWLEKDENRPLRLPVRLSVITFSLWLALLCLHFEPNISPIKEILGVIPITFRVEIEDWLATLLIIIGLLLCGYAAYVTVRDFRKKAKYSGALILFLAATPYIVSWYLLSPSKREAEIPIVAVAKFIPIGGSSDDDAIAIARRIRDQLSSRFAEFSKNEKGRGPIAKIKFLKNFRIEGSDEQELGLAAVNQAKKASADLIVWGEVSKEDGMLKVIPKISITGSTTKAPKVEFQITVPEDFKPPHLIFKDEVAQDTARLATFICGLIYYFKDENEKALPIFQYIGDSASNFYAARILAERAQNSPSPQTDLLEAKALFERVINSEQNSKNIEDQELYWDAVLNLGNVFLFMGIMSHPDVSQGLFQQAIDLYDEALKISPIVRVPTAQAQVQNNLGMALIEIAIRKAPLEQRPILDRAVTVLETSLKSYDKKDSSDVLAAAKVHLGIALRYLSRISDNEVSKQLLNKAITYLNSAESHFHRTDQLNWAVVRVNKAAAFAEFAKLNHGDEKLKLLKSSVTSLQAIPDLPIKNRFPYLWAMGKYDLGNSLCDLAEASGKYKQLYEQALQSYEASLTVFCLDQYPQKWAQTQESIALVFFQLARISNEQQAKDRLGKAAMANQFALEVYSPTGSARDWARVQLRTARILGAASFYQTGEERNQTLMQAQESLTKALSVLTRDSDPEEWAEAELVMGGIAAFLAKSERDLDRKIELNKESVHHLRTALTVFALDQHPDMWARAKSKIGDVLRELGLLLSGDEGKQYLSDAVLEYREGLKLNVDAIHPSLHKHLIFSLAASLGELGLRSDHLHYGRLFRESAEAYLNAFGLANETKECVDIELPLPSDKGDIQIEGYGISKHLNEAVRILNAASNKSDLGVDERAYVDFALGMVLFQAALLTGDCDIMDQLQVASSKLEHCLTFFDAKQYPNENLCMQRILMMVQHLKKELNDSKIQRR
jgi:tetratricopeptide (TPR) repeat protein